MNELSDIICVEFRSKTLRHCIQKGVGWWNFGIGSMERQTEREKEAIRKGKRTDIDTEQHSTENRGFFYC